MKRSTTLTVISTIRERDRRLFNHEEAARLSRVPIRSLLKYWNAGLIHPCNDCQRFGIYFDEEAIYRVRKTESIRTNLQANIASASAIFSLSEEIDSLKQEVRFLREGL